jgi:hypothetical protein
LRSPTPSWPSRAADGPINRRPGPRRASNRSAGSPLAAAVGRPVEDLLAAARPATVARATAAADPPAAAVTASLPAAAGEAEVIIARPPAATSHRRRSRHRGQDRPISGTSRGRTSGTGMAAGWAASVGRHSSTPPAMPISAGPSGCYCRRSSCRRPTTTTATRRLDCIRRRQAASGCAMGRTCCS